MSNILFKKNFEKSIIKQACKLSKRIVLPEATNDERVMLAANIITQKKIAKIVILGNKEEIALKYPKIDLTGMDIFDPKSSEMKIGLAQLLFTLRKHKGMTEEQSAELVSEPLVFGALMVKSGYADGMVAGATSKSADVIRTAIQIIKTAPDIKTVSGAMIMLPTNKSPKGVMPLLLADISTVITPTAQQLADIAITSAKTLSQISQSEPLVAFLSYSTVGSGAGEPINIVKEALKLAKEKAPQYKIDGEFQFDTAISPRVANLKGATGEVAGNSNVLIFPDLQSGNIGCKILQHSGNMHAIGPILQGLAKPVNDLSRGCTTEEIITSVAITAIQAEIKLN
ncbi:MAG: phosphate acetyltransferase [Clostridia bacterium]|jgi:phosphate acetyltransferase|nr:phosphate acetyltransferase [Clostridia bacterium]